MIRVALATVIALCLCTQACTLFNAPDRTKLDREGCTREKILISENWTTSDLSVNWAFAPTEPPAWQPSRSIVGSDRVISDFGLPNESHALIEKSCAPMALGNEITVQLRAKGQFPCDNDEPCDEYAGVVLSRFDDMNRGERLLDELAVSMHAGGYLQVTQSGNEVASELLSTDEPYEVRVQLAAGFDEDNVGALFASVRVSSPLSAGQLVGTFRVIALEDLLRDSSACSQVPGLNIAIEGKGDGVDVGTLLARTPDCANPGQFDAPGATLTSEIMGFNPSWTTGSIGAPSLASSRNDADDISFEIMVDGSNDPPELEQITHVGYAIGHASTTVTPGQITWGIGASDWLSSGVPKLGDDPPSCVGSSCPSNISAREPHIFTTLSEGKITNRIVSYAREVDTSSMRDVFALHISDQVDEAGIPLPIDAPKVAPNELSECVSLRDPSVFPANSSGTQGYWAMFTCERDNGLPSQIHALRLQPNLEPVTPLDSKVVIDPSTLGAFAEAGVFGAEPLVAFIPEQDAFVRVWFMARSIEGDISVGLVEAEASHSNLVSSTLPSLMPFPVNPVLTENASVLGGCPGICELKGLAVARRADDFERLRFVLARSVNSTTEGRFDELIPLEQFWRLP